MVLAVFFGMFSIIVVLSEITLFVQIDLSVFGNLIKICQGFVETEVKSFYKYQYIMYIIFPLSLNFLDFHFNSFTLCFFCRLCGSF